MKASRITYRGKTYPSQAALARDLGCSIYAIKTAMRGTGHLFGFKISQGATVIETPQKRSVTVPCGLNLTARVSVPREPWEVGE